MLKLENSNAYLKCFTSVSQPSYHRAAIKLRWIYLYTHPLSFSCITYSVNNIFTVGQCYNL